MPIALQDTDWIRSWFPAFADPELSDWAHMENAGGSWVCRQVLDRWDQHVRRHRIQGHPHFPAGAATADGMASARAALCRHLGVVDDELFVGPSTSQHTYVLAHAFRSLLGPGDAIVVTDQDHEANSGVWRRLADVGVDVREWRVDPDTGHLDVADLERLLDDDVAVVAFPHVSNVVGETNDVSTICGLARLAGAVSVVDGVAAAPHGLPDVGALGADVHLFSAYKTFGPHQGVMTVRRAVLDRLPNEGHFFLADAPGRSLVPAGPDHAQVTALGGVAAYFDDLAVHLGTTDRDVVVDAVQERERALLVPLLDFLRDRRDCRIVGPDTPEGRAPTVAIATTASPATIAARLAEHRVMAAAGHFYAHRLLSSLRIGPDHGVVRLSFLHYTAEWEIARTIDALDAALTG